MKKILALLNVKKWAESFVAKLILNKGIKHGVTAAVGLVMGAKVQGLLNQYGVTVDATQLQAELTVAFTAAAGAILNWAQKVMDKDGDGIPG